MDEEIKKQREEARKQYYEKVDSLIDSGEPFLILFGTASSMQRSSRGLDKWQCIGCLEMAKQFYMNDATEQPND